MQYMLKNTDDEKKKRYLLNHFFEQFKGTLYRQTMFAEFEMEAHAKAEHGEVLSAESLCAMYKKLNEKYFGPDMVIDDEIALEWARIPHFTHHSMYTSMQQAIPLQLQYQPRYLQVMSRL